MPLLDRAEKSQLHCLSSWMRKWRQFPQHLPCWKTSAKSSSQALLLAVVNTQASSWRETHWGVMSLGKYQTQEVHNLYNATNETMQQDGTITTVQWRQSASNAALAAMAMEETKKVCCMQPAWTVEPPCWGEAESCDNYSRAQVYRT